MTHMFSKLAAPLLFGSVIAGLGAQPAFAQDNVVSAAKAAGTVGEQSDGYLGIKGTVGADVRSAVDALNIKRRAAYTDLAAKRNVTVQDAAAITACQTLATRVQTGQIYKIGSADWQVKGPGAIALPAYCASSSGG